MIAVLKRMYPKHTIWTCPIDRAKPSILRMPNAIIGFITNLELSYDPGPWVYGDLPVDHMRLQQAIPRLHTLKRLRLEFHAPGKPKQWTAARLLIPGDRTELVAFYQKIFGSTAYRQLIRTLPVIYQVPQGQTIRDYTLEISSYHTFRSLRQHQQGASSLSGRLFNGVVKYRPEGTLPATAVTWSQEKITMVNFVLEDVEHWIEEPPKHFKLKLRKAVRR